MCVLNSVHCAGNPALKMQHWLRSLNAECDPFFSEDFESMMRTKSEQASRNGAGQESREQHSGATTEVTLESRVLLFLPHSCHY